VRDFNPPPYPVIFYCCFPWAGALLCRLFMDGRADGLSYLGGIFIGVAMGFIIRGLFEAKGWVSK